MYKELTPVQLEILKALREHKESEVAEIWSMDKFYNEFHSDIEKNEFTRSSKKLEYRHYITRVAEVQSEEGFGCYEITEFGLRYLDDIGD